MGRGSDDKVVPMLIAGCCCLIIGSPILIGGIILFTGGLSGGPVLVPMCCSATGKDTSGQIICTEYITSSGGCSLSSLPTTKDETSASKTGQFVRTDASYTVTLEVPVGGTAKGTVFWKTGTESRNSRTVELSQRSLSTEAYCAELGGKDATVSEDDQIAGYPVFSSKVLEEKYELPDGIADGYTLVAGGDLAGTDPSGSYFHPSPVGTPLTGPRISFTTNGLSSRSTIGLVLIIIGGIIVCPPVTVIAIACGAILNK